MQAGPRLAQQVRAFPGQGSEWGRAELLTLQLEEKQGASAAPVAGA